MVFVLDWEKREISEALCENIPPHSIAWLQLQAVLMGSNPRKNETVERSIFHPRSSNRGSS